MGDEVHRLGILLGEGLEYQTRLFADRRHEFEVALKGAESIYDPSTPSHKLSYSTASQILKMRHYLEHPEDIEALDAIYEELSDKLMEMGYRGSDALTYHEHTLIGSTEWEAYEQWPHRPIMIIRSFAEIQGEKGNERLVQVCDPVPAVIAEAQKARDLAKCMSALGRYFKLDAHGFCSVTLEPLDANGDTVRDPRMINSETLEILPFTRSTDYPHRRANLD